MTRRSDALPNLSPTSSRPPPDLGSLHCALFPTYPTFEASRVYRATGRCSVFVYVSNRLGRLGRLGIRLNRAGLRVPNLCPTSVEVGFSVRGSFLEPLYAGNSDPDLSLVTRVLLGGYGD